MLGGFSHSKKVALLQSAPHLLDDRPPHRARQDRSAVAPPCPASIAWKGVVWSSVEGAGVRGDCGTAWAEKVMVGTEADTIDRAHSNFGRGIASSPQKMTDRRGGGSNFVHFSAARIVRNG